MVKQEHINELNKCCAGGVEEHVELGISYILLPALRLPAGCAPNPVDALICLGHRDGYPTRLFFSGRVERPPRVAGEAALNWNASDVVILERKWFAYSWKDVTYDGRPLEVLLDHMKALA